MAAKQQKCKKYNVNFKLFVVKYAEENSGEAAARRFSVDPKRVREWRKNKTELQRMSLENCARARLPGGGRKKASEQLEANMREWVISKRERQERVPRQMIRAMAKRMYASVSDRGDEEFAASAGWLNRFLRRNNFTLRRPTGVGQKDPRELAENLAAAAWPGAMGAKNVPDGDVIAMDEAAVWFRGAGCTVETRAPPKTTGHKNSHFTVVLAAKADGTKLKPFVVFRGGVREVKAMQRLGGVVTVSSKNGRMNDDLTADWLQKVVGKFNVGPRLLVWDSHRCHVGPAAKEELERGYNISVVPAGCSEHVPAPGVVWNRPFKASLHESYDEWMASDSDKSYTAGGSVRAPALRLLVAWVLKAWEKLDVEMVKNSFKVWLAALRETVKQESAEQNMICEDHFLPEDITKNGITSDAIPIMPPCLDGDIGMMSPWVTCKEEEDPWAGGDEDGVDEDEEEKVAEVDVPIKMEASAPDSPKQEPAPENLLETADSSDVQRQSDETATPRKQVSLGVLTQCFLDMLLMSPDGTLDLELVARSLKMRRRRVYDITNVLDGIGFIEKDSAGVVKWTGKYPILSFMHKHQLNFKRELQNLKAVEDTLDTLIKSCAHQLFQMTDDTQNAAFAYITHEDVNRLQMFQEQTVLVVKAPEETKLEVPPPNQDSIQMHLKGVRGPIAVKTCTVGETSNGFKVLKGSGIKTSELHKKSPSTQYTTESA